MRRRPNMQNSKSIRCVLLNVLGLLVLSQQPSLVQAQPTANPAPNLTAAERRWQELSIARQPSPNADRYTGKNAQERVTVKAAEVAQYVAMADRLQAFYTEFPEAAQVKEARRYEALNLLLAAQAGDNAHEGRWRILANEVRRDQTLPTADRYAVAAQADYFLAAHDKALSAAAKNDRYAAIARSHAAEFPTEPGGFASLLALARNQPAAQAKMLAEEVASMPAPGSIKLQAAQLAQRFALVGLKLDKVLADAGFPDALKAGTPLVVYSWASWSDASQQLGAKVKTAAGSATLIGLCLDTDLGVAKTAAEKGALPGQQIYDSRGAEGAMAQALKLNDTGWVYLVDRTGKVVTVRGQDDLNAFPQL